METLEKESSLTNVEELTNKDSGSELVSRNPIEGTPFTIISLENKHFGIMGEYRVTEEMKSKGEVEDELKCITWNRIIQVMMILEDIRKKDKNFDEKVKKQLNNK
jgi:hypothetical protein